MEKAASLAATGLNYQLSMLVPDQTTTCWLAIFTFTFGMDYILR